MRKSGDILSDLIASGLTPQQLALVSELTASTTVEATVRTPRQERNRRYYESQQRLKASEKRLNSDASESVLNKTEGVLNRLNSDADQPIYIYNTLPEEKEDISTRSREKRARPSLNGHQEDFERWYAAYPRHVSRGAAELAFGKALKIADIETLVHGAEAYAKASAGKEAEFIKHPATWLRSKCWADESAAGASGHKYAKYGRGF